MSCCCSGFCSATERQFDHRRALREVVRYRRKGAPATTRMLRDGLRAAGPLSGTVLDIGAGIGALTFELMAAGVTRAVAVDASTANVAEGRKEANDRGVGAAVEWRHGDFVRDAADYQAATIVTLDRVVCCYPAYEPLLAEATRRAERWFAISYPRDRLHVRAGVALENATRRVTGNPFRTFVHPPAGMDQVIRSNGLRLVNRQRSMTWIADVYERVTAGHSSLQGGM